VDSLEPCGWISAYLVKSGTVKHIVVVNPNNPTGEQWTKTSLLALHKQLAADAYLIVDEAFMDVNEQYSLRDCALLRVIVLRSVGKFFGLAGIRLGFVIGQGVLFEHLRTQHTLWGINHLALWLGEKIFTDTLWQQQQRQRIQHQYSLMNNILAGLPSLSPSPFFCDNRLSSSLFITLMGMEDECYQHFITAAKAGILLRYGTLEQGKAWLRFGLPSDAQLPRLQQYLQSITHA
jgi:cobalamin biosynthesis protein CobC